MKKARIPRSEIVNPNLNPVILDSATQVRDLLLKNNMKDAEVKALYKLRYTSRAIERMEEKVAFLVKEADKL